MRIFTSITSKLRFITELTGLIFNNFNLMTINKEKISQEKLMVQTIDRLNKRSRQKSGPPKGSNDVHIRLPKGGKFTKGRWSTNGRLWHDEWEPPVDANDFHLVSDSSQSIAIHFPKDFLFKSAGIVIETLAGSLSDLATDNLKPYCKLVKEKLRDKFTTSIRVILGVSFLADSEECIRITNVLPSSPAEVAGLLPGDTLIQIGKSTVSGFSDVRDVIANLSAPVTFPIIIRRENTILNLELTPGFYIFQTNE